MLLLARLRGFEPLTYGLEVRCSILLSYRRAALSILSYSPARCNPLPVNFRRRGTVSWHSWLSFPSHNFLLYYYEETGLF